MSQAYDILAIDDDKLSQRIINKALKTGGYNARLANDGESGLKQVLQKIPDIILLDVEMPGMNGYEVCERLRELAQTRDVPVRNSSPRLIGSLMPCSNRHPTTRYSKPSSASSWTGNNPGSGSSKSDSPLQKKASSAHSAAGPWLQK